jgi:hypothetical protein
MSWKKTAVNNTEVVEDPGLESHPAVLHTVASLHREVIIEKTADRGLGFILPDWLS